MDNQANEGRKSAGLLEPGPANVQLIYILYLVALVVGITGLIGIVIAYMNRGKTGGWLETHYAWVIRTFWIGLLYGLISMLLMFIGIGFLLMLAVAIWLIVRCVIGLQALNRGEPIKNPQSWII
jgi:uncharacterized membrane protein